MTGYISQSSARFYKQESERLQRALRRIAEGPYAFDYEHERFEECQRTAKNALEGGELDD